MALAVQLRPWAEGPGRGLRSASRKRERWPTQRPPGSTAVLVRFEQLRLDRLSEPSADRNFDLGSARGSAAVGLRETRVEALTRPRAPAEPKLGSDDPS